jgi:phosphoribosyl-ATP pyrophosphohydrolase/phosphoribosyl-AMP cyclohydrolase
MEEEQGSRAAGEQGRFKAEIQWDEQGLVPAIVQDARTGQVLTLAYMNQLALEKSISTGETHFWSRSRSEMWHKGATSGNTQRIVEIRYDCDGDALLLLVEPRGPACHTGQQSCFYHRLWVKESSA